MIAHRYLRGRVDGYLSAMEQAAARRRARSRPATPIRPAATRRVHEFPRFPRRAR